jgi:hypothetical protein
MDYLKAKNVFSSHHCRQSGKEIILAKYITPCRNFKNYPREFESKSFNELDQSNHD